MLSDPNEGEEGGGGGGGRSETRRLCLSYVRNRAFHLFQYNIKKEKRKRGDVGWNRRLSIRAERNIFFFSSFYIPPDKEGEINFIV